MSARINKEEQERIRKDILKNAYQLFSKKGYEDTKTKEISDRVGIAEGTLFNYFSSKANLYMEAMLENFEISSIKLIDKEMTRENVIDIILEYVTKSLKIVLKLPKTVIKEIIHLSTYLSKKKRKIFDKFAETDFKAIAELEEIFNQMHAKGFIKEVDTQTAASTVFAAAFFELLLYVYEDHYTKDDMLISLRKKLELIVKPYVK
ncbi:MAG: TetR/AcrR family transcriptional regulator [Thermotogota bacterium]